ncbi:MAG: hypothetical protein ACLUI3_12285 [Christensenellales bacterium]
MEHYGVLMQNEYAAEAYVYAVLRNTSGQRLPIQSIQMTVKNGSGRALHEERYVSHLPGVVEPNGTLLVSEWMYDFTKDIGKVASIDITVETDTRAYERWNRLDGVRAWQEGQYLYVELTNTTEETLFGASAARRWKRRTDRFDMMLQSSYETMDVGIARKSTVVWRKRLEDGATLKPARIRSARRGHIGWKHTEQNLKKAYHFGVPRAIQTEGERRSVNGDGAGKEAFIEWLYTQYAVKLRTREPQLGAASAGIPRYGG